jgi:hypothetical protein
MRRLGAIVAVLGAALLGSTLAAGQTTPEPESGVRDAPPTRAPELVADGVRIERLASTLADLSTPPGTSYGLDRYTYEPGASYDATYAGPTILYVEEGTLAIEGSGGPIAITRGLDTTVLRGEMALEAGTVFTLSVGESAFAPTGDFGLTRNAGETPLVLLVLLVVPQPPLTTDAPVVATATGARPGECATVPAPPAGPSDRQPVVSVRGTGSRTVRVVARDGVTSVELDRVRVTTGRLLPAAPVPAPAPGERYVALEALELTVENLGDEPLPIGAADFQLEDAAGGSSPALCGGVGPTLAGDPLPPGESRSGWVTFEVTASAEPERIVYQAPGGQIVFGLP